VALAQLFVPLHGAYKQVTGSGFNAYGEDLNRPTWEGAEIGLNETYADMLGAVGETEYYEWVMGAQHPLFKEGGPAWCRFLDPDPALRQLAIETAVTAAQSAHYVGCRYILFHFPWPGFHIGHADEDTLLSYPAPALADFPGGAAGMHEAGRVLFERMAALQETERIKIIFAIDGPNPYVYEGDLYERLFSEFPSLSLCVDTGRLGLLARIHGQDPLALARRWLPWTRHLHLSTSLWDEQGRYQSRLPTNGTHTYDKWPRITPAADIARMVVEAQPKCTIVLEHDPRSVSPTELEEAHAWAAALVSGT
jgi:sugar phosphate isomerase/epimerase